MEEEMDFYESVRMSVPGMTEVKGGVCSLIPIPIIYVALLYKFYLVLWFLRHVLYHSS